MDNLIAISEMAKLYGITRQTLIYYDEIDLFKPVHVDAKGYRYYSRRQIPHLREICFLKSIGVSLKDVLEHFNERSADKEIQLLQRQRVRVMQDMAWLSKLREAITQRISLYEESVEADSVQLKEPFLRAFGPRRILFKPYLMPINRENLHITLMSLWRRVFQKELVPCGGFGLLFDQQEVLQHQPLAGAGSYVFLPSWNDDYPDSRLIPAGEYACFYKYGMPYETESIYILLDWINCNGYELCGDILDVCLLDTTFYKEQKERDYCMLQAPVRLKV